MLQNKFLYFLLFSFCLAFSQQKTIDTIYVYEEVIVHDTVFVEKPINEKKLDKVVFIKNENDKIGLTLNGEKIQIKVDSATVVLLKNLHNKTWFFGGKLYTGTARNTLFKKLNAPADIGIGLGIWTKKRLFNPRFLVGIGIDASYWMSPFTFDATKNESSLNGYYFTENNQPKLFQSIDSKHFQLQIPIQFYYKIQRFTPSIGAFANISSYKAKFLGSSGVLPLTFDETQVFKAEALQIGFLAELQYELSKHISVGINFSSGKAKNLVFTNKNDSSQSFKTDKKITENRLLAQLIYQL